MDIFTVNFEEPFTLKINGETIKIIAFETLEQGNIKFGVDAPRSVKVHREEIYQAINRQKQNETA